MGFFDTVLNMGEKLVSKAQENMAKIQEYKESVSSQYKYTDFRHKVHRFK